jgi:hypothetical protein
MPSPLSNNDSHAHHCSPGDEDKSKQDAESHASTVSLAGSDADPAPAPGTVLSNQVVVEEEIKDMIEGRAENVRAAADQDSAVVVAVTAADIAERSRARAEQIASNLAQAEPVLFSTTALPESTDAIGPAKSLSQDSQVAGTVAEPRAEAKGVHAALTRVTESGEQVVSSSTTFFGGKSRSVLQRIVGEMRELRTALAASGFA